MVSVGQESERSLTEFLWLKTSHEVVVKLLGNAVVSSKGSIGGMVGGGAGVEIFQAHSQVFFRPAGLFTGLPHNKEAGFHQDEQSKRD